MTPEEKLANRLLARHSLVPPYDLINLVRHYADLEYEYFPFTADGITIGVKSARPTIYINRELSPTRSKFTLAHELGHVKIPWHIGTIVSDLDNYSPLDHNLYREKEAEANRFAAELLMPSSWVIGILSKNCDFKIKLEEIYNNSGASLEAVLIKVMSKCIENRYLLIMNDDYCAKQYKAQVTKHFDFENKHFDFNNIYSGSDSEIFLIAGRKIITFLIGKVDKKQFQQDDSRTWRELLITMIDETSNQNDNWKKIQLSANAVLNPTFQKNKLKPFDEICSAIRLSYEDRPLLAGIVGHELFPIYIKKRVEELLKK